MLLDPSLCSHRHLGPHLRHPVDAAGHGHHANLQDAFLGDAGDCVQQHYQSATPARAISGCHTTPGYARFVWRCSGESEIVLPGQRYGR